MANDGTNQPEIVEQLDNQQAREGITADTHGQAEFTGQVEDRAPADDAGDEPSDKPQMWKDEKRAEIYERARRAKAEKVEDYNGDPTDPRNRYGNDVDMSDMGPLELEALRRQREFTGLEGEGVEEAQQQQQEQAAQPKRPMAGIPEGLAKQTLTLKIDGQDVPVTLEELARNAQMYMAGERRLTEANTLLGHVKDIAAKGLQAPRGDEQEGQDDPLAGHEQEPTRTTPAPKSTLNARDLADKIQLGTPDEILGSIKTIVEDALASRNDPDETTRVLTVLDTQNAQDAIARFAEKNPAIFNDTMQAETTRFMHQEMAKDLIASGRSLDELRQKINSPAALLEAHRQLRLTKHKAARSTDALLEASYTSAQKYLGELAGTLTRPAPQGQVPANRQERKAGIPSQPAPRRLTPTGGQQQQQRSQEASRQNAFQKMRDARMGKRS